MGSHTSPLPDCSIIICTINRVGMLRALLSSLKHIRYSGRFEVIVVAGPCNDGTHEYLETLEESIKYVACPDPNVSLARNMGVAAADSDVVVFIDDDAHPQNENWLTNLVKPLSLDLHGGVAAVGGEVINGHSRAVEFHKGLSSDYCHQAFTPDDPLLDEFQELYWFLRVPGGNAAYSRQALLEIGGFDSFYRYYADEVDVCLRLLRKGYKVEFAEDAQILHFPSPARTSGNHRNIHNKATRDTYYCLKNSQEGVLGAIWKTLKLAPSKRFIRGISLYRKGTTFLTRTRQRLAWATGVLKGVFCGLFIARKLLEKLENEAFKQYPVISNFPRKRVCFIGFGMNAANGVSKYTGELMHGYHERGYEVHVISCGNRSMVTQPRLHVAEHFVKAEHVSFRLTGKREQFIRYSLGYSVAAFMKLVELICSGIVFDVVESTHGGNLGVLVAKFDAAPLVTRLVTTIGELHTIEKTSISGDMIAQTGLENWFFQHVSGVITSTSGAMASLKELPQIKERPSLPLRIIPYGIIPQPEIKAGHTRQKKKKYKMLFHIGRVSHRKGTDVLFECLPDLMARHTDYIAILAGNYNTPLGREWVKNFKERFRKERWSRRVLIMGPISERQKYDYFRRCDIFCAPSRYESFGLIYIEAMQFGKACVGTTAGGIPEVIEENKTGLLAEPGDAASLSDALEMLMQDSDLREQLGKNAKAAFRKRFNYNRMAEESLEFYEQVAEHWCQKNDISQRRRATQLQETFQKETGEIDISKLREEGISAFLDLIDQIQKAEIHVDKRLLQVSEKYEKGDYAGAISLLENGDYSKTDESVMMLLVELLVKNGDHDKAYSLINKIYKLDNFQSGELQRDLNAIYAALQLVAAGNSNEDDLVTTLHKKYLEQHQEELKTSAVQLSNLNKHWMAAAYYACILKGETAKIRTKEQMNTTYNLASSFLKSEEYDQAEQTFASLLDSKFVRKHAQDAFVSGIHFHMANLYINTDKRDKALIHAKMCLDLNPHHRAGTALLNELKVQMRESN